MKKRELLTTRTVSTNLMHKILWYSKKSYCNVIFKNKLYFHLFWVKLSLNILWLGFVCCQLWTKTQARTLLPFCFWQQVMIMNTFHSFSNKLMLKIKWTDVKFEAVKDSGNVDHNSGNFLLMFLFLVQSWATCLCLTFLCAGEHAWVGLVTLCGVGRWLHRRRFHWPEHCCLWVPTAWLPECAPARPGRRPLTTHQPFCPCGHHQPTRRWEGPTSRVVREEGGSTWKGVCHTEKHRHQDGGWSFQTR